MLLQRVLGWLAVAGSTLFIGTWSVWGILENFHEGWYYRDLGRNLLMLLYQYLAPMLAFLIAAVLGVLHPPTGFAVHLLLAAAAAYRFRSTAGVVLIGLPLVVLGALYLFGRPAPRNAALLTLVVPPVLLTLGLAVEPALRVSRRHDDGDRGLRRIDGNGVSLLWAPAGPGWPSSGVDWHEAVRRCEHLAADGRSLAPTPQHLWRLPTLDEAVRSMVRQGRNCGGAWDPAARRARYARTPDKESPLWDAHSKVIYWWTATEAGPTQAYRIAYNGHVLAIPKGAGWGYLAFRCVRPAAAAAEPTGGGAD